jgi:hypothetical protein
MPNAFVVQKGKNFVLGFDQDFYGIWPNSGDLSQKPLYSFPKTNEGWLKASDYFKQLEESGHVLASPTYPAPQGPLSQGPTHPGVAPEAYPTGGLPHYGAPLSYMPPQPYGGYPSQPGQAYYPGMGAPGYQPGAPHTYPPGYPYYPQTPPGTWNYSGQKEPGANMATLALIASIVGVVLFSLFGILPIIGLVLGLVGLSRVSSGLYSPRLKSQYMIATILGSLGIAAFIVEIVVYAVTHK